MAPAALLLRSLLPAALLAAGPAQAACGLSFCPRPEDPGARKVEFAFAARETGFDLGGDEGSYTELMVSAQMTAFRRLAFGLHAPFILLHLDGETEAGFGNLLAFAEWRAQVPFLAAFAAGAQLEIPTGAADQGLADDHFMAAPYVSLAFPAGPAMLGAALGTAATLHGDHGEEGGHHHHGADSAAGPVPVYVHPHEEWEAFYRVSAGLSLLGGSFLPEVFLDGQRVLSDPEDPEAPLDFLALGISLPFTRGAVTISPSAALPLLAEPRQDWTVGLHVGWRLQLGGAKAPSAGET